MPENETSNSNESLRGAAASPASGEVRDYGDPKAEFFAATQDAAVFELGARTLLELTGNDRQKYLHNFCTNEIRNLRPGQGCEAFVTTIQGKIKAHIFVFADENSLWIDSGPGYEDLLFAHLDKYLITEDVQFARRSAEYVEFYVSGEKVLSKLAAAGLSVSGLELNSHLRASLNGWDIAVRRLDWLGSPGCLIQVRAADATKVRQSLVAAGLVPAGRAAFDALRILAGLPEYGVDFTEGNLAQEAARTNSAISFTKGCYLGQEPIARIDSMGHVNQELRALRLAAGPVPIAGDKVVLPGEVREAGVITSAAWDYGAEVPVAMALIKRNYLAAGTKLTVVTGTQEIPATVLGRA
jgi:folate-binding protein YgfZ